MINTPNTDSQVDDKEDRPPQVKGLCAKLSEADLFRSNRLEQEIEQAAKLWKVYWTEADQWFVSNKCELQLLQICRGRFETVRYSLNFMNMTFGACWNKKGNPNFRGLYVHVTLRGRLAEFCNSTWYPNRHKLEAVVGLPLEWECNLGPDRYLSVYEDGFDHRDRSDWPRHFAWYAKTGVAVKRALIGDFPFREYTWNILTDEEKARNREFYEQMTRQDHRLLNSWIHLLAGEVP